MSNFRPFVRRVYASKQVRWPSWAWRRGRREGHQIKTKPRPGGLFALLQKVTGQKEPLG